MKNTRQGRCYLIALRTMLEQDAEYTLCHGSVGPLGHAWLEIDGEAFDVVLDLHMPAADYLEFAVARNRYSKAQALQLAAASGHCGPWA